MKKALITGINGQDGSYLAEHLLSLGYQVHGTLRRSSSIKTDRIDHISDKIYTYYSDLEDSGSLSKIIDECSPDEIYNLAAQSHVKVSFEIPAYTSSATGLGVLNLLEVVKNSRRKKEIKIYQAGSSEMFGASPAPQSENTRFLPQSPYACAKVYAHYMCRLYREAYGMYICNGILFNHESPRRGDTFVTKKIAKAVARIVKGKQHNIQLGNLDAKRDWGFAPDYVRAMHLMIQEEFPDDYVIATGEMHTVREFVEECFGYVNLNWENYIVINEKYYRPVEVDELRGDYNKAKEVLNWKPKVKFKELCKLMMDYELSNN